MIMIFYVDVIIYAVKSNVSISKTLKIIYNWTKVNNKHVLEWYVISRSTVLGLIKQHNFNLSIGSS